ncbi:efflux transporter outer membrane subunit [Cerasicoccus frondis]|uniref:efflux transporter outer membrane subunit n=1 Tax=Cerasicoccus frondis TaxID=490090 RepID=UPI0028524B58|nr:efflux transporter outer membrane subunit [Cerasicoccus frondis]
MFDLLQSKTSLLLLGGALGIFATGCTVGPDYQAPEFAAPAGYSGLQDQGGAPLAMPEAGQWWLVFNDAALNELITQAAAENRSLRAAYNRWLRAETLIRREKAEGLPQVGAEASYTRERLSEETLLQGGDTTQNVYNVGAAASMELDLFGRVRRLVEAASADADAEREALADLQLYIETQVAITYFQICATEAELVYVEESLGTREKSLEVVTKRFEGGAVSDLDVAQAESLLAGTRADYARLKRQQAILINALSVLTGQPASEFEVSAKPLEGTPPDIPAGVPSELLLRRPDIRQSERLLQAANARIGVATANFYPRFVIAGDIGLSALDAAQWMKSSAGFWAISPQVSLPLFEGGRLRANLDESKLAYAQQVADYEETVLTAFAEVEDAVDSWRWLKQEREAEARSSDAAIRAQNISAQQYDGGLIDFITALDSERTALESQRRLAVAIGAEYENAVLLVRAIGGSW